MKYLIRMNKNTNLRIAWLLFVVVAFFSCKDNTETADPYADWQVRNEHYLDSIVHVARNVPEGEKWEIYRNYKLNFEGAGGNGITQVPPTLYEYDSVYVKIITQGTGAVAVGSTDTAYVCYQGFLMNGTRFDGNYVGTFDPKVNVPSNLKSNISNFIAGWTTALLYMKAGTFAELYIPYQMAYGTNGYGSSIPGYSVLKFELYLDRIVHPIGPDDRSLKRQEVETSK